MRLYTSLFWNLLLSMILEALQGADFGRGGSSGESVLPSKVMPHVLLKLLLREGSFYHIRAGMKGSCFY